MSKECSLYYTLLLFFLSFPYNYGHDCPCYSINIQSLPSNTPPPKKNFECWWQVIPYGRGQLRQIIPGRDTSQENYLAYNKQKKIIFRLNAFLTLFWYLKETLFNFLFRFFLLRKWFENHDIELLVFHLKA